jgi:hypothetical protein
MGGIGGIGSGGGVPDPGAIPPVGGLPPSGPNFGISSLTTNPNGQIVITQEQLDALNSPTTIVEAPLKTYTIADLFTANFALIDLAHAIAEGWRTDLEILLGDNFNIADLISYDIPPDITNEELAALNEDTVNANNAVIAQREANVEYNQTVAEPQNALVDAYEICISQGGDQSTCGDDPGPRLELRDENVGTLQPLLVRPYTPGSSSETSPNTAIGSERQTTGIDIEEINPGDLGSALKEILSRPDSKSNTQTSIVGIGLTIYRGAVTPEVVGVIDQVLYSESFDIFRANLDDAFFPPELAPPLPENVINRIGDPQEPGLKFETPFPVDLEGLIASGYFTAEQIAIIRSLTTDQIILLGGPAVLQELALTGQLTVEQLSLLLDVVITADVVPVEEVTPYNTPPPQPYNPSTVEVLRVVTGTEVRPIYGETLSIAIADAIIPVQFQALSTTARAREEQRVEITPAVEEAAVVNATVNNLLIQANNTPFLIGLIRSQVEKQYSNLEASQRDEIIKALLLVVKQTLIEVAEILSKRVTDQNAVELYKLNDLQLVVRDAKIEVRNEFERNDLRILSDTLSRVFEREINLAVFLQEFIDPGRTLINLYSAFNKQLPDRELDINF